MTILSRADRDTGEAARSYIVGGHRFAADALPGGLYVVATPIGNLRDVTLRALATLAGADVIACEDTRVTQKLTGHYGIGTRLSAYHEHNAERQLPRILAWLAEGKAVALVSDAGTPLISDPGYRLVGAAAEAGHRVFPIPGASAVMAALACAGLPTDQFHFAGFLPNRAAARRKRLAELAAIPGSLIVFESPHRTADTLRDMAEMLGGERRAVLLRELTKTFETVRRDSLDALAAALAGGPEPKGEIVILVGPPTGQAPDLAAIDDALADLLKTKPTGAAASELAARTGLPRRDIYQRALALRGGGDDR